MVQSLPWGYVFWDAQSPAALTTPTPAPHVACYAPPSWIRGLFSAYQYKRTWWFVQAASRPTWNINCCVHIKARKHCVSCAGCRSTTPIIYLWPQLYVRAIYVYVPWLLIEVIPVILSQNVDTLHFRALRCASFRSQPFCSRTRHSLRSLRVLSQLQSVTITVYIKMARFKVDTQVYDAFQRLLDLYHRRRRLLDALVRTDALRYYR